MFSILLPFHNSSEIFLIYDFLLPCTVCSFGSISTSINVLELSVCLLVEHVAHTRNQLSAFYDSVLRV